jgi:hypothetical protein
MNVPLPFALKAANKQKAQEYEQVPGLHLSAPHQQSYG